MTYSQLMLIVTKDMALQKQVSQALAPLGFRALHVSSDRAILVMCEQKNPVVILIDLRMLGIDDIDSWRNIRQCSSASLIVLVPKDAASDGVAALDQGADEYLVLPVEERVLLAHVRAVLRRSQVPGQVFAQELVRVGELEIDLIGRRLLRAGELVHLTRLEWSLLGELIYHRNQVLTHRMLLQRAWGDGYSEEYAYLQTYIRRLRRKLEDDPSNPHYLINEPGIGYRFAFPEANSPLPTSTSPTVRLPTSMRTHLTNLPAQPNPLIGREQEVIDATNIFHRSDVRLVTFCGAPGIGKTRLGLAVAANLLDSFEHGVFFVALAPIRDPGLVASTISQSLGVKEVSGQPLAELLKDYLRDKQMLLMLDNFEQVVVAAPLIVDLLTVAVGLKVLVTSRALLRVSGEYEFPVPPLALPDLRRLPSLHILAQTPAIALFTARTQAVRSDFVLTDEEARIVAEICTRLDGLPLAIELAAARTRRFPPKAILPRLTSQLSLLTGGLRNVPARQQSLRATIDWSYELLDTNEQTLFARLGVFIGGCTLESAEAVCSDYVLDSETTLVQDPKLKLQHILDGLEVLLDNNLLWQERGADDEPRFMLLETIHEYALEKLVTSGENDKLQRRHANYYLTLVEMAEPQLMGVSQKVWLERLEQEHNNLRMALRWSLKHGEVEMAMRMGGALWRFWSVRGYWSEGRQWLEEALAYNSNSSIAVLAKVLHGAGSLACNQSDYARAKALFEDSLVLRRKLGDKDGIARTLNNLGQVTLDQGDYVYTVELLEESLVLLREQENKWGIANVLSNLGAALHFQGYHARAITFYEESLVLHRELGVKWGFAFALGNLGLAVLEQGDYSRATALCEESLAIFRELGDKQLISDSLIRLGRVALGQDDYYRASRLFEESLTLCHELGGKTKIIECLLCLAVVAGAQVQSKRVALLCGAVEMLCEAIGVPLQPTERPSYERTVTNARAQIDEAVWTAAWAEGRAMTLEQAVTYALNHDN